MSRHTLIISLGDTNPSGPSPEPCSFSPSTSALGRRKGAGLLVLGCRRNLGVGCREALDLPPAASQGLRVTPQVLSRE